MYIPDVTDGPYRPVLKVLLNILVLLELKYKLYVMGDLCKLVLKEWCNILGEKLRGYTLLGNESHFDIGDRILCDTLVLREPSCTARGIS
jgi:hypothetical protein